jgi:hypothetical protein
MHPPDDASMPGEARPVPRRFHALPGQSLALSASRLRALHSRPRVSAAPPHAALAAPGRRGPAVGITQLCGCRLDAAGRALPCASQHRVLVPCASQHPMPGALD